MYRFYGKYRFFIDGRKLVFWEGRLGLISKDRTTIRDKTGAMVALPPECCMFLALSLGDGTFYLQPSNGEIIAANTGNSLIVIGGDKSRFPFYPIPLARLRFSIAALRNVSGTGTIKLHYWNEYLTDKHWYDKGYKSGTNREVDAISGARQISNITNENLIGSDWTVEQLGDGVDQIAAARKVVHFDFTPAGKSVVDLSGENFAGVDCGRADFSGSILTSATLSYATFNDARPRKTNLDRANFTGATLTKVVFAEASMKSTTLSGAHGTSCDFSYCDLFTVINTAPLVLGSPEDAPPRLAYAGLNYSLIGADWKNKDMQWATLRNVPSGALIDATKANLSGVVLSGLTFASQCKFDNANLRNASLVESRLPYASFKGALLDGSTTPELAGADFAAARLQDCKFDDAHCARVNFPAHAWTKPASARRACTRRISAMPICAVAASPPSSSAA